MIQPGTRGTTVGKVVLSTDEYENVSVESCELLPVIDDSHLLLMKMTNIYESS